MTVFKDALLIGAALELASPARITAIDDTGIEEGSLQAATIGAAGRDVRPHVRSDRQVGPAGRSFRAGNLFGHARRLGNRRSGVNSGRDFARVEIVNAWPAFLFRTIHISYSPLSCV